jgi:hypothetical protein
LLTGKRFILKRPTLALEASTDKRSAVTIPAGATIAVLSGPTSKNDTGTLTVEWDSRTLAMFAIDLEKRGTEIKERTSGA